MPEKSRKNRVLDLGDLPIEPAWSLNSRPKLFPRQGGVGSRAALPNFVLWRASPACVTSAER